MPRPPARKSAANPAPLLVLAVLGAAVAYALATGTASPAPFGVPLPELPNRYETEGVEYGATDVSAGKIPPAWLESLALQPDGSPPLLYSYSSSRGGFSITHPRGTEVTQLGFDKFVGEGMDAYAIIHHNQPLQEIHYNLPVRVGGEKVTEFVARMRHEVQQLGGEIDTAQPDALELVRYRFSIIDFSYPPEPGAPGDKAGSGSAERRHRIWYIGPLGDRLLVIEFRIAPGRLAAGRAQADKIMHSFRPRNELALLMLEEDPQYGEWAGTPAVQEAEEGRKKREAERLAAEAAANP